MNALTFSKIEQIAQDVESWGDGWRFLYNPDDGGRRARLSRAHSAVLDYEIEIAEDNRGYFVHIAGHNCDSLGRWTTVSASIRNPRNRKALDYINEQLDLLEVAS